MAQYEFQTRQIRQYLPVLRAGDTVLLTGTVYTARDAAHKRLVQCLAEGQQTPFPLKDAIIYYAGPTPAKPGQVIGSCGPTTAGRMDPYAPLLLRHGLAAMIGKGARSAEVIDAMQETGGAYLVAIGGAGALIADKIKRLEVVAYDDLGCESIKRLTVEKFPAIVAIDALGGNLYQSGQSAYRRAR